MRSKVAGFNEEEFQKILADIESANKEMLIIQKNLGANSESLEQAKNHSDERSKLLSKMRTVSGFILELDKIRNIVYRWACCN